MVKTFRMTSYKDNSTLLSQCMNNNFYVLPTISIDYVLMKFYDDGLKTFHSWYTSLTVCGSIFCIVLNSFLIFCLLTIDEFKSLIFFPIGLQAVIDVIGPGITNIISAIISHQQLEPSEFKDYEGYVTYIFAAEFADIFNVRGTKGCILTFLDPS